MASGVCVVATGLDLIVGFKWRLTVRQVQDEMANGETAYLQDQARLRDHPWFVPRGRAANAAELLDALPWWPGYSWGDGVGQDPPNQSGTLEFPAGVLAELLAQPRHAWSVSHPLHARFPDTAWMTTVHQYDHWEFAHSDPPTDEIEPPTPGFSILAHWAAVHLRRGIHDGNPAAAAADVRHIAQLLISTEDKIAAQVAKGILDMEAQAHAHISAAGVPVEGWEPVSPELREAFGRIVAGGDIYANLFSQNELRARTRDPEVAPVGYCIAQNEAGRDLIMWRGLLRSHWPTVFADYEAELAADFCRSVRIRRYWEKPDRVFRESDLALTPLFGPAPAPSTGPDPVVLNCAEHLGLRRLICRRQALHIGMTFQTMMPPPSPYYKKGKADGNI